MEASRGRWRPVHRHRPARLLVLLTTAALICAFALAMRAAQPPGAVLRVSLVGIPVEHFAAVDQSDLQLASADSPSSTPGSIVAELRPIPAAPVQLRQRSEGPHQTGQSLRRPDLARASAFVQPDADGVLPLNFSLIAGVGSEKGGVGVPKKLTAEGGQATDLTIFLIGGSEIEVDRAELVAALGKLGAGDKATGLPPASEGGRLSLNRVRTAGLDLQYDAIRDRLVLRP